MLRGLTGARAALAFDRSGTAAAERREAGADGAGAGDAAAGAAATGAAAPGAGGGTQPAAAQQRCDFTPPKSFLTPAVEGFDILSHPSQALRVTGRKTG